MDTSAIRSGEIARPPAPISVISGLRLPTLTDPPVAPPGRIDVAAVVARLRHLDAAIEPALVFSQLAEVLVPGVCDEVVVDLAENDHAYRIRRPAGASDLPRPVRVPTDALVGSDTGPVVGRHVVMAGIRSTGAGSTGPTFSGTVVCRWRDGYLPVAADASLIGLMIDHAVALIHRERRTETSAVLDAPSGQAHNGPTDDGRIASAVGVVMALHHVDRSKAMELLVRISGRTGRGLSDVADSVVESGTLPELPAQLAE